MAAGAEAPSRRSRISPERVAEVLQTTLELVTELGYDRLSMADIAKRAQCSTATLYRQWESKPRLVITAFRDGLPRRSLADIDTGSLRGDLTSLAHRIITPEKRTQSVVSIWHAVMTDSELMAALREIMIEPEMRMLRDLLNKSVMRGEIEPGNPALVLADRILFGPLIIQELFTGRESDIQLVLDVIDHVLIPALTVSSPTEV